MRSTIAPEISAGVMIANISWNIACACSGIVAPYAASGSKPTPLKPSQASPPHQGVPCPNAMERSEEHTSELQSRPHLVCRLLLEKKKKNKTQTDTSKNELWMAA